jgi:phenylpropionate dioxygenase-like ring-hydroxylating dioxygenase large terminal subunit
VPALIGEPDAGGRAVNSYPVVEQQGYVWAYATAGEMPDSKPFRFRMADDSSYLVVHHTVEADASVHSVAENALDVPHTAFLHAGLFRNDDNRNRIRCEVKRWHDRVQCEYIGEPRPPGLVATLLSPSGGIVTHFDRFFLPSIVEVEYRIGTENHIVVNGACTPIDDNHTRLYSVTAVRSRIPGWLVRPFVQPLALQIFHQDRVILELQTETTAAFGETIYRSTEIDLLGPHILRLMQRASKGDLGDPSAAPWQTEIEMDV